MNFQVPQFIEIEDKVIGPLSFKQFIYVAGGLAGAFVIWKILPDNALFNVIKSVLALSVAALGAALAFWKINNRPFIIVMEAAIKFFTSNKLYVWKPRKAKAKKQPEIKIPKAIKELEKKEKLSESKLHELAWSLDITDSNK